MTRRAVLNINGVSKDVYVVAAGAREHGLVLFTRDAHFQEVDGLLTASSVDQLLP
jgi:predicted nucleic acid-binding protein